MRKPREIYGLILSEDLMVSKSVHENEKEDIIKGLRDISHRGAKCVILYPKNVEHYEDLTSELTNVDIKIVSLPKLVEKTLKYIEKLVGIDLPEMAGESIDKIWYSAIKLQEEEADDLDEKLDDAEVNYYPERETRSHYLMKKIVFYYLKKKNPDKEIRVEQPIELDDQGRIKTVVSDIRVNGENWEIETGYPTRDEETMESNPRERLIWKLSKYSDADRKVNVVIPSVYAYLFREDIKKVKRYFKEKIALKFYTLQWYREAQCKLFMK